MPLPGGFSFRDATIDDADLWARLRSDDPRLAADPVVERETWDEVPPGVRRERRMIQDGGIPVGRAALELAARGEGPQFASVRADFLVGHQTEELLAAAWADLEARARELGAEVFISRCQDHQADRRAFLEGRGYLRERSGIISQLDIGAQPERFREMAAGDEARLRSEGIELTTLDRVADRMQEIYAMFIEALSDIPTSAPIPHESPEQFGRMVDRPWTGRHRVWVAMAGERPIGISWLGYYPTTGIVFTEMTGVARAGRGKGVGAALKLKTIEQALGLGVGTILTENDADNPPILKINRALGYQALREELLYRRPA